MISTINNLEKMTLALSESRVWSTKGKKYITAKEAGIEFFGRLEDINKNNTKEIKEYKEILDEWKDIGFDFISKRWFPDGEFIGKEVILDMYAISWYPIFIAKLEGILYLYDGKNWNEFSNFVSSEGKDPYGIIRYLNFLVKQL